MFVHVAHRRAQAPQGVQGGRGLSGGRLAADPGRGNGRVATEPAGLGTALHHLRHRTRLSDHIAACMDFRCRPRRHQARSCRGRADIQRGAGDIRVPSPIVPAASIRPDTTPAIPHKSIAVLPFADLSPAREQEYFSTLRVITSGISARRIGAATRYHLDFGRKDSGWTTLSCSNVQAHWRGSR